MAGSFDTPVLVTEVDDGRFRLFCGGGVPAGVPLREPKTLGGLYRVSGPMEAYHRLAPPKAEITREDVLAWLQQARMLGCQVREVEPLAAHQS